MRRRRPRDAEEFEEFFRTVEPRLNRALVATYGSDIGREATIDALAWAWEHWSEVQGLANPGGYLYRVGQSRAKRAMRPGRSASIQLVPESRDASGGWYEPGLHDGLTSLTDRQRVCVVLCRGFQWTHAEVADLLEVSPSTVQNHVERATQHLKSVLGVEPNAKY